MKKCVSRGRAAPPSDEGGVTEGDGGRERRVGRLACETGRRGADPYRSVATLLTRWRHLPKATKTV